MIATTTGMVVPCVCAHSSNNRRHANVCTLRLLSVRSIYAVNALYLIGGPTLPPAATM